VLPLPAMKTTSFSLVCFLTAISPSYEGFKPGWKLNNILLLELVDPLVVGERA
jgi:hypothetical protein